MSKQVIYISEEMIDKMIENNADNKIDAEIKEIDHDVMIQDNMPRYACQEWKKDKAVLDKPFCMYCGKDIGPLNSCGLNSICSDCQSLLKDLEDLEKEFPVCASCGQTLNKDNTVWGFDLCIDCSKEYEI